MSPLELLQQQQLAIQRHCLGMAGSRMLSKWYTTTMHSLVFCLAKSTMLLQKLRGMQVQLLVIITTLLPCKLRLDI